MPLFPVNASAPLIAFFTDFGWEGPYMGQMRAVLAARMPHLPVIDLCTDVPNFAVEAASYLLPAYASYEVFPAESIFVCVVDPGVGTARRPVMVRADERWYVGPDNGLFTQIIRRAETASAYEITWTPPLLSTSFHGRDLFTPVAAQLAGGQVPEHKPISVEELEKTDWPDEWDRVCHMDRYGNLITGRRAQTVAHDAVFQIHAHTVTFAPTFGSVPVGQPFWYRNSSGLVEIAVNQGDAGRQLSVGLGTPVTLVASPG